MRCNSRREYLILGVTAALLGGCTGPELRPAPQAQRSPGPGGPGVERTRSGIRVAAYPDAWGARPESLGTVLTPLLVRLRNEGEVPVAVRYEAFQLVNAAGRILSPIPPFSIEQTVTEPVTTPGYRISGFEVAPYLGPFYPGMAPFGGPFAAGRGLYGTTFPAFREVPLPTPDMIRAALPEGVLRPGGDASGFLYFPEIATEGPMRLEVSLANAESGERVATLTLPFVAG